ncbi:unnamed protein product [Owenia fusiformis]|uniref:Uncharacterized protein n=1 Tax=Owenia fusiformis TaxID=6347 RepID=A0A8J1UDT4_OWEFU|nr:unnamed protein product [Owenia fusiformis]
MASGCGRCCFSREDNRRNSDDRSQEMISLIHGHPEHLPTKDYESLDYDWCHNEPFEDMLEEREKDKWHETKMEVIKWVVTFVIGVFTGLVALFIDVVVKELAKLKFGAVEASIMQCSLSGCLVLSLLLLIAINGSFVLIASVLTSIEPVAAGSGIPEIKCYLNGVKVPNVVRLKTLVSKAVGVLFSVAGGLFVGKEGPMIHSGAIIGAGVPQFQSITCKKINFKYEFFRTDRDKRDFVSGGAAAGVAAAFGAPIGGVLFSLEEGSSFWNQKLTWRTFFCSMSATFTLNFFLSGIKTGEWGFFYLPGLIDFGVFKCTNTNGQCHLWNAVDLLIFIAMGFIGGLLGALFNSLNTQLTKHRMKYVNNRHKFVRILEALLVAMVTSMISFIAAMTLGECRKLSSTGGNSSDVSDSVRTYFCHDGYYNDMATLFFNPMEIGIKQLFHQEGTFSMTSLAIFFMCFFFLACWTYGASVPSGLFVPCLFCGAAYGRFVATILVNVFGYTNIYSGTFALVGAAAFLGGVVRMTISLTVILIESTNEISYGLPIMIVLMVAKWSGDLFNEGLYDIHIELKDVPLLGWDAPINTLKMKAHDIMETSITYMFPHTRILSLVSILKTTCHHAYPVVTIETKDETEEILLAEQNMVASQNIKFRKKSLLTRAEEERKRRTSSMTDSIQSIPEEPHPSHEPLHLAQQPHLSHLLSKPRAHSTNSLDLEDRRNPYSTLSLDDTQRFEDQYRPLRFHGMILRSHLIMLLKNRVSYQENIEGNNQTRLSYEELTRLYPRYPNIHDINLSELDPASIMDVTPYMNPCPYMASPHTPVTQIFNLFRSMGLRHLPIINNNGELFIAQVLLPL